LIERVIDIDLPRPRTMDVRESPEFQRYVHELTSIFMGFGVLKENSPSTRV
jgi:NitT/TauT family transport system ATP-binding protein